MIRGRHRRQGLDVGYSASQRDREKRLVHAVAASMVSIARTRPPPLVHTTGTFGTAINWQIILALLQDRCRCDITVCG